MTRPDGRAADALRPVRITRGWLDHAEGSVLVEFGKTRVLCAASVTEEVPRWRRGSGLGWVTAEYAMLPRATNTRNDRESVKGRLGGRTHEISRLVGRSLRAAVDYKALGENTIVIDCDVLQADGGTRTAAVTGGYVALADAIDWLRKRGKLKGSPLVASVAAVSVGIVGGQPRLDLCYEEDSAAETDMNVVCTGTGDFVEIQGTAEREPFSRAHLGQLLDLATVGCAELSRLQAQALDGALVLAGNRWLTEAAGWCSRPGTRARSPSCRGFSPPSAVTWRSSGSSRSPTRPTCPRPAARSPTTRCSRRARSPPTPGCLPSPTTPGWRWTRCTACRACCRPAGRASTATTRPTWTWCSASWPTWPSAAPCSSASPRCVVPAADATQREWTTTGVLRGRAHPRAARQQRLRLRPDLRALRPADHDGGARAGREGRDQPPRPRVPRHRAAYRCNAQQPR